MNRKHMILVMLLGMLCGHAYAMRGGRSVERFDYNWLFQRYGLQPDGSRVDEPKRLETPDYEDSGWRQLNLPHDWAIEGPFRNDLEGFTGKLPWKGIGWYRKHFSMPAAGKGRQVYLDFDGAMANAQVWLNGHLVGGHPYGYTSFRVDLTPYIQWGDSNVVAVRLDTEHWGSRWYPGAGIYRHVRLVQTEPLHVAHWGVFVTTPEANTDKGTAVVRVKVENHHSSHQAYTFKVELYELTPDDRMKKRVAQVKSGALSVGGLGTKEDSVKLHITSPRLWSIEAPNRYMAKVTIYDSKGHMSDCFNQPFGFRTIAFSHDRGFLLNDKQVKIQGTCNHHDLGALGAAVNTAALRRQLTLLKGMGCNAIRTSHNPPAPDLLDLADKMGLVVMDEAFDCWEHGKKEHDYGSLFKEWHVRDLEALILRDRNHPSVIMWSTGNEVHEQYYPETGMARHLTEVVHRFDTTRPATFGASYPSKSAMNGTELQVDVHGMNYAAGIYGGPTFYGDFLSKPGHEHLCGYSSESSSTISSRGEYFPRPFHVTAYDTQEPGWGGLVDAEFAALDRYPGICGEFVWTGFDYLGEPTPFNSDNSVLLNHAAAMTAEELAAYKKELDEMEKNRPTSRSSYFGIFDLAGFPKDRMWLYKAHWLPSEPMAHILPHWNLPGREGKKTPVYVYTSGDEAELFQDGRSLGRKRKGEYEYRLRWEDVVYTPGRLHVVAYKDGREWARDSVTTTGSPVALRLTADKTVVTADGDDLAFIRISCVDKEGREVPNAEPLIRCSVEGRGEVVATDNGDPTCHIIFSHPQRPAFNGLLLAIVRPSMGHKGKLVFKAEADGLEMAQLTIRAK